MKMFFTSFSKYHSSAYLYAAFQSKVGSFSGGPSVLGITCTNLTAFTRFVASLTAIIAVFAASMAACVIP